MKHRLIQPARHTHQTSLILGSLFISLLLFGLNTVSGLRTLLIVAFLWLILGGGIFAVIISFPSPPPKTIDPFLEQTVAVTDQQYTQVLENWQQLHFVQPRSAEINRRYLDILATSPTDTASLSANVATTTQYLSP